MNKPNVKVDVLKKLIARLTKLAPARKPDSSPEPLARLLGAFLEYDCDDARAELGEKKILSAMVDFNELRVTPAIELAAILGVRYPFAESRCSALHRTLQSIFDREHQMRFERLAEMKKSEIRPYLQSLAGITPYVEAVIALECFDVCAAPVDTKLLLWLISKEAFGEDMDIRTVQHVLEKNIKASDMDAFHRGARKELEGWSPKSWPAAPKVHSPVLAPPPLDDRGREIAPPPPPEEPKAAKVAPKAGAKSSSQTAKAPGVALSARVGRPAAAPVRGKANSKKH